MANFRAIAAIGKSVVDLLRDASRNRSEPNRPAEFSGIDVGLFQTSDFQSPKFSEGVSLYLYRVEVNGTHRNRSPRTDRNGQRYRPSLPVDLHYLLTAWSMDAEKQQRLLGWCMRELENVSIFPAGLLNHYGSDQETFDAAETVELLCESLTLDDMAHIREAFKSNVPLSVGYVARMVTLDSEIRIGEGPLVQTRELRKAREVAP